MSTTTEKNDAAGQQRGIVTRQRVGRWPGEQERQPLTDSVDELWEIASRDCYGAGFREESTPCKCESCICRRAVERLQALMYPVVRSLTPDRLSYSYSEMLYFEAWKATNERQRGLNNGRGTLEILVEELGPITQRDMDVATAVVQWLGTSCGTSFVHEVERHAERVRKEGRERNDVRLGRIKATVDSLGITRPEVSE